jgi:hypothetical protein
MTQKSLANSGGTGAAISVGQEDTPMMKMSKLVLSLGLLGSLALGGVAAADERYDTNRTVIVRDHRVEADGSRFVRSDAYRPNDRVRLAITPQVAPPPIPAERAPRARGYVWISGEYQWLNGRYLFIAGHYEKARRGFHWVAATWTRHGRTFEKIPGHWERA